MCMQKYIMFKNLRFTFIVIYKIESSYWYR